MVIATPGAEPISPGGYAAVVLDASAILGRPELWAPEEAMRRWFNVLSLVRPDGEMIVVGVRDNSVGQVLIRRDPMTTRNARWMSVKCFDSSPQPAWLR